MPVTYCTADELRDYLSADPISGTNTTRYEQAIYAAERAVDRYTRQPPIGTLAFTETASATRTFNDHFANHLHPITDLLTVSAVTRNGVTISSSEYQLHPLVRGVGPATAIEFSQYTTSTGGTGTFYRGGVGYAQISITGTWGFCTRANLPLDVKEATLALAGWLLRKPGITINDFINALINPSTVELSFVRGLLEPYRRYGRAVLA